MPRAGRLAHLDILRGAALLGVLLVNLHAFSGASYLEGAELKPTAGAWGGVALLVRDALFKGKAIGLLSVLFGVGLAIQQARHQGQALGNALRRLGSLALLGLAHSVLLWNGDVLLDYALVGLLVLPFQGRRAYFCLAAIPVVMVLAVPFQGLLLPHLRPNWDLGPWLLDQATQAYGSGTWREALGFRLFELHQGIASRLSGCLAFCTTLFLLGMALWKAGWLADPLAHRRGWLWTFHLCFWPGLALHAVPGWLAQRTSGLPYGWWVGLLDLATQVMVLGILAGGVLLLSAPAWAGRLAFLAPLGRMSLSAYLSQSLVCTWVFHGHGLGAWNRVPVEVGLLGGLGLFALQAWACGWWLRRFRLGPAEWLWRSLAQGALLPMNAGAG